MRHRAVVDNAVRLYLEQGSAGVTPAAVAKATGLARSSVYQYFPTSGSLIGAAVEQLFSEYAAEVLGAVDDAGEDPDDRLVAYVRVSLAAAARSHAASVNASDLPEECRIRLAQLHDALVVPLREIIAATNPTDARRTTALAMGTIQGAVQLVDHGADLDEVHRDTVEFLRRALS